MEAIRNRYFPYRKMPQDLSDCTFVRDEARPWRAWIIEPLQVTAPRAARPLCCYLNTVLFYEHPHRVDPETGEFAQWDRTKTRLEQEDVIRADGECFRLYHGSVHYELGRWIMRWSARREGE